MRRKKIRFVHEGKYAAEVEVELIETLDEWSPYLSLEDACKLDDIRDCLKRGDIKAASIHAKVYELTPIAV
jgi:hypothetical protein